MRFLNSNFSFNKYPSLIFRGGKFLKNNQLHVSKSVLFNWLTLSFPDFNKTFFPNFVKGVLSIFLLVFTTNVAAQVNLHIAGNNGVGMYIGQDHVVQALGAVGIGASGTLSFENVGMPDFRLKGDFTNAGTLTHGSGSVTFNGAGNQTIAAGGTGAGKQFHKVVTDKSGGAAILSADMRVNNQFTLTAGEVDLDGNTLNINSGTTSAITRTAGFIKSENTGNDSKVAWNVGATTGAHLIPFGKNSSNYIPFTFNLTAGNAGAVTVSTYGTGADLTPLPVAPQVVSNLSPADGVVNRFWQIDSDGSPTATLIFTYAADELPADAPYNDPDEMVAVRYDSGTNAWQEATVGQSSGAYSVTVPGITQFSPWAIKNQIVVLPVQWMSFTVSKQGKSALINWATASEINNEGFEVQKSTDGENFVSIAWVAGKGNSAFPSHYSLTDNSPTLGNNYYRIVQKDFDGKSSTTDKKVVNFEGLSIVNVFPNPSKGEFNITVQSSADAEITLIMYDALGKLVKSNVYHIKSGINNINENLHYARGRYFISVTTNQGNYYDYSYILIQ